MRTVSVIWLRCGRFDYVTPTANFEMGGFGVRAKMTHVKYRCEVKVCRRARHARPLLQRDLLISGFAVLDVNRH